LQKSAFTRSGFIANGTVCGMVDDSVMPSVEDVDWSVLGLTIGQWQAPPPVFAAHQHFGPAAHRVVVAVSKQFQVPGSGEVVPWTILVAVDDIYSLSFDTMPMRAAWR
jgi:hypothetical protein